MSLNCPCTISNNVTTSTDVELMYCRSCGKYQHLKCVGLLEKHKNYECPECQSHKNDPFIETIERIATPFLISPPNIDNKNTIDLDAKDKYSSSYNTQFLFMPHCKEIINKYKKHRMMSTQLSNNPIFIMIRCLRLDEVGYEHHWPFNGHIIVTGLTTGKEFKLPKHPPRSRPREDHPIVYYFEEDDRIRNVNIFNKESYRKASELNFLDLNKLKIVSDYWYNDNDIYSYYITVDLVRVKSIQEIYNLTPKMINIQQLLTLRNLNNNIDKSENPSIRSNSLNNKTKKNENNIINKDLDNLKIENEIVALRDVMTSNLLTHPIRSINCYHLDVFDLESFLILNRANKKFMCPHCKKKAVRFYIDSQIDKICRENRDLEEVCLNLKYEIISSKKALDNEDSNSSINRKNNLNNIAKIENNSTGSKLKVRNNSKKNEKSTKKVDITVSLLDDDEEDNNFVSKDNHGKSAIIANTATTTNITNIQVNTNNKTTENLNPSMSARSGKDQKKKKGKSNTKSIVTQSTSDIRSSTISKTKETNMQAKSIRNPSKNSNTAIYQDNDKKTNLSKMKTNRQEVIDNSKNTINKNINNSKDKVQLLKKSIQRVIKPNLLNNLETNDKNNMSIIHNDSLNSTVIQTSLNNLLIDYNKNGKNGSNPILTNNTISNNSNQIKNYNNNNNNSNDITPPEIVTVNNSSEMIIDYIKNDNTDASNGNVNNKTSMSLEYGKYNNIFNDSNNELNSNINNESHCNTNNHNKNNKNNINIKNTQNNPIVFNQPIVIDLENEFEDGNIENITYDNGNAYILASTNNNSKCQNVTYNEKNNSIISNANNTNNTNNANNEFIAYSNFYKNIEEQIKIMANNNNITNDKDISTQCSSKIANTNPTKNLKVMDNSNNNITISKNNYITKEKLNNYRTSNYLDSKSSNNELRLVENNEIIDTKNLKEIKILTKSTNEILTSKKSNDNNIIININEYSDYSDDQEEINKKINNDIIKGFKFNTKEFSLESIFEINELKSSKISIFK